MNASDRPTRRPRILIVSPEIAALPASMDMTEREIAAKAGGLADATALLVAALEEMGADVHVALPNYHRLFGHEPYQLPQRELRRYHERPEDCRVHLAEDRAFYYQNRVYSPNDDLALHRSLVFQREVIHHIVPRVRPDLIHCNDWTTSLIPAMARRRGIKSLFTLHNIHSHDVTLERIESTGLDAAEFWTQLYFAHPPGCYEQTRGTVPVQLLASAIFAADHVNTVSPGFLREIVDGWHDCVPPSARTEIRSKHASGHASGILNAPDPSYHPSADRALARPFTAADPLAGKAANKLALQQELGLHVDPDAAVFFWPSRLDPVQKGPELLTGILHRTVSDHWSRPLQLVVVADGPHQQWFHQIVRQFSLQSRVAIRNFDERLARLAYAGSDFTLMPSRFEPCGLPQMIAPRYGSLPVVHATGGLRDTVRHLDAQASTGNGFRFEVYDENGLRWAIEQAMLFHSRPQDVREREIRRVMEQAHRDFDADGFTRQYIALYESLLDRPLLGEGAVKLPLPLPAASPAIVKPHRSKAPVTPLPLVHGLTHPSGHHHPSTALA